MLAPDDPSRGTLGTIRRIAAATIRLSGKLWKKVRYSGVLGTLWHLLIKALSPCGRLELAWLYEYDLERVIPRSCARVEVTVEQAAMRDAPAIASLMLKDQIVVEDALACGELCFVARANDHIVHINWIAYGRKESLAGCYIVLPRGAAYCYSGVTHESWRGLGIHTQVNSHMLHYLKNNGMGHAYTYVAAENRSSRKTLQRLNWQHTGLMLAFTRRGKTAAKVWRLSGTLEPFTYQH